MADSHSDGDVVGKFCALRTKKCKDGNEYQENCDPPPTGWKTEYFWQGSLKDDGTNTTEKKIFEAHHLLCIAVVTEIVAYARGIKKIIENTDWCINDTINMFAMPLWGHTIKYYCTVERDDFFEEDTPYFRDRKKGPKFENIPQHDDGHGLYIDEVRKELKKMVKQIKNSKKNHEKKVEEIKSKLNDLAGQFRTKLQDRGIRSGGTHVAWKNHPSDWYKPFSMAKKPRKRTFPTTNFNEGVGRKIMKRANSFYYRSG